MNRDECAFEQAKALLPADATHRAWRGDKLRLADVMAGFLLPNDLLEPCGDFVIRDDLIAEERTQVVLGDAKKARADFPIGGQSKTVAVSAEWLADWRNNSDFSAAVGKSPAFGRGGRVFGRR